MAHDTNMTGELFVGGYPGKVSVISVKKMQSVLQMFAPFSCFFFTDKKTQSNVEIRTNDNILIHGETVKRGCWCFTWLTLVVERG